MHADGRLYGRKGWVTDARHADRIVAIARAGDATVAVPTDPGRPGVEIGPELPRPGRLGISLAEVTFTGTSSTRTRTCWADEAMTSPKRYGRMTCPAMPHGRRDRPTPCTRPCCATCARRRAAGSHKGIEYLITFPGHPSGCATQPVTFCGPTCDPLDSLNATTPYRAPVAPATGDRVVIWSTGTYCSTGALAGCNGYPPLPQHVHAPPSVRPAAHLRPLLVRLRPRRGRRGAGRGRYAGSRGRPGR